MANGYQDDYVLEIGGYVERPMSLTIADLREIAAGHGQTTFHHCAQGFTSIGKWRGIPVAVLLDLVKPLPSARAAGATTREADVTTHVGVGQRAITSGWADRSEFADADEGCTVRGRPRAVALALLAVGSSPPTTTLGPMAAHAGPRSRPAVGRSST